MTKKKVSPINSYTLKTGETRYEFPAYLGVDPLTGKQMRTKKRGFKTRKEAELALARIKLDVANGTYQQKRAETYQELYDLWIVQYEKTVEESTFVKTLGLFKNHILPSFSQYKIDKITIDVCQKHFYEWTTKVSAKTALKIKAYAAKLLDYGIVRGYIQNNPFAHIDTKVKSPIKDIDEADLNKFYTREQLIEFLNCCENHLPYKAYALLYLLAFTGLRKGEALALTWNDFDIKTNELAVTKAVGRGKNARMYLKSTKTGTSRSIKLDNKTMSILDKWRALQKAECLALGFNTNNKDQLMFSNSKNEFLQLNQPDKWMISVQKKFNLEYLRPHGLRHTHCSLLFEAGATIKAVQTRLGHSSIKITLEIYTHVTNKAKDDAIDKFASYLEI